MGGARGGVLDHHPFRHRRAPRPDVPDRLQRHQRPDYRRVGPGAGRLCQRAGGQRKRGQVQFAGTARRVLRTNWTCPLFRPASRRPAAVLRGGLRHAAPLAALRRAFERDHGGGRLHGLFPRRLPQHAGAFLRRPPQGVRLRGDDHRQPQPAQRQRGEGLRAQRRAVHAAARRRLDPPHGAGDVHPADALCRGPGGRQGRLLPGGGRRRLHQGGAGPKPARPAGTENPLLAIARRGGLGRVSGAPRGRLPRSGNLRPARHARRRLPQRPQARRQPGESGRLRHDDRTRPAERGRADPGDRSRL